MMHTPIDSPTSIDDHLGPSATRFFGAGYRRVGHRLRETELGRPGELVTTVAIDYPDGWSSKASVAALRPHLSTVDALLLGVRVSEMLLLGWAVLAPEDLRRSSLRRVQIKAPSQPYEDGLADVGVRGRLVADGPAPDGPGRRGVVDATVGTMKVRCEIDHPDAPAGLPAIAPDAAPEHRLYAEGYRRREQRLDHLELGADGLHADARATLRGVLPTEGIGSAFEPAVSFVDAFVMTLQLGQILLYRLDSVDRSESNTLWMRHTTLTASRVCSVQESQPVRVRLEDPRLVAGPAGTWRTATVVGECQEVTTRCAVAHQLSGATSVAHQLSGATSVAGEGV